MFMKVVKAFKFLPAVVIYCNWCVPKRFDAFTFGPFIFMRKEVKDSKALLAHELTHVKQFYRRPIVNGILYLLSEKYRLRAEIEAYAVQLCVLKEEYNLDLDSERFEELVNHFATKIALDYNILVHEKHVARALFEEVKNKC